MGYLGARKAGVYCNGNSLPEEECSLQGTSQSLSPSSFIQATIKQSGFHHSPRRLVQNQMDPSFERLSWHWTECLLHKPAKQFSLFLDVCILGAFVDYGYILYLSPHFRRFPYAKALLPMERWIYSCYVFQMVISTRQRNC